VPEQPLTIVVYHRGEVEPQIAPLRPAAGLRLELVRKGTLWTVPQDAAGVLWELAPEDGAQRLVSAMISTVPAASFGAPGQPGLPELSRALGFRAHLTPPLTLEEVERALGLNDVVDLADRIEAAAPDILQLASRPDALAGLVRAVNASSDPAEVAATIAARAAEWLPLTAWHVLTVEPDGGLQWPTRPELPPTLRALVESFGQEVARAGQPALRVTNFVDDRASGGDPNLWLEAAVLAWPLVANGAVVAVLAGVDEGRSHRLPQLPGSFVEAFTRLIEPSAFALSHAIRVARAEALSVTDDLTQLYNSRYLHDALRKETKRAVRNGRELSLLFVDLDGFKRINDAHGHLLGSRALIEAADVIRGSARETDIVARFGGDEFAMLLPDTGAEGAQAVARRLCDRIQRFTFLGDRGGGNRLTASIGVATLPDVADTADGLLQAADAAMYRVKVTGKNGIHVAGSGAETQETARVRGEEQEQR
jgi:diguanylate cyclase (GGDEF)-like protein